jgi:hypothetical protein
MEVSDIAVVPALKARTVITNNRISIMCGTPENLSLRDYHTDAINLQELLNQFEEKESMFISDKHDV